MAKLIRTPTQRADRLSARHIALAWYTQDQWLSLKQVAIDPEVFNETYADWLETVKNASRKYRLQGLTVHEVPVDVDELIAWCDLQERPLNGHARAAYALAKYKIDQATIPPKE